MFTNYFQKHNSSVRARELLRYIGPGLLITVGFIDPGNWASNLAAGADFGYLLLWMVTLSTIMLILLQHNAAHLGIVTGLCMAEAATKFLSPLVGRTVLGTAMLASVATALAEILGGAIALELLFGIPLIPGSVITAVGCAVLLRTHSYKKLEKLIIAFVSLIGLAFLLELNLMDVNWQASFQGWVTPSIPPGSIVVIMSVLGAVVMPHNLFLHSEIIQSRQWNLQDEKVIRRQLKYEFIDTLLSMGIGWAINSAMIIIAAGVFFTQGVTVTDLGQATELLKPLLGNGAALVFAVALLFAGISSTATCGMAGGSIYSGIFGEEYNIEDYHSWHGVLITYGVALVIICMISDPFMGLIYSQMFLSIQLPVTIALLLYLTSSRRVMGKYVNSLFTKLLLGGIGVIVAILNVILFYQTVVELWF